MRVETLTPVVAGAPGSRVQWRIRVENDAAVPVGYRLRVIGFDPANVLQPPPRAPLEPGSSDELDLELLIPEAFAAGHHSIAIEVTPDRVGVAPVIAAVTVTVGTIDDVALAVVPSTIRARRRATFRIDIDNRSREPRELELEADSAELEIRMQPDRVLLQPGERVRTTGRIKGPRHLVGEPRQHSLTVAARSKSAPSYAPATFQQRALFPRGVRTILAMLLIVGIWGGALGAGYLWWQSRDDEEADAPAELVDTDGDGIRDTPADQLVDTDGDGVPDTMAAVVAEQVASGAALGDPQPGGSDVPTRTSMGGTVAAADGGQAPDVDVTLTPIDVGAPLPEGATQLGFRNGELREVEPVTAAKFWPARFGRYQPDIRSGYRQTQSVPDATSTDERGVWYFGSLSVGQSYEVSFSRPGFDTQSFVVTPSADGKPIDLPVEMQPADGVVRGTVTGPGGGLGNVTLTLSDGTLVFDSASASEGDVGTFSFTGVSTPGTYTLLADARGLGTEVVQVTLEEGEDRGGVNIRMSPGVGSISGRVTESGSPLGGVTLTASNGDTTVETTSLTQGAVGTYLFPRLTIPGRWTIEARLDGYVTQTRLVNLNGNVGGIDFAFVKRTGSIIGLVESSNGGPLTGVNIRVSRDDLVFESQSAVSPDPGSFNIRDVPPGTYLVELSRYDHEPTSQTVTVDPGRPTDLGTVTLVFRPRPNIPQNGGLEVQVVDSEGAPIRPSETAPGATVRVFRTADNSLVAEQVGAPDQSSFFFQPLPIGTYRVEVTRGPTYRLATRNASVGLSNTVVVIPIYRLGQVFGRVIDSFTKEDLDDYDIQIMRVLATGEVDPSPVQNIPILDGHPPDPGTGQIRWESAAASLTTGLYEVRVSKPPPGYSVTPDQELVAGQPLMRFRVLPTDDRPIELRPIEADHFPELSGVVLAPRLGAGNVVSFVPIDRADLAVTLTCPGVDGVDQSVTLDTAALPNLPGEPANSGLGDIAGSGAGFDTYFFGPITLQSNDLSGACTLRVTANDADYVPAEFDVLVSPGDGRSNPLLFRNVVLFRPEDVGGRLYWMDDGTTPATQVWAPRDVSVAAQGAVTVGMTPGTVPFGSTGSNPNLQTAPLPEVFTDDNGAWAYGDPKQVFGEGFYTITDPGRFELRRISLTIDETEKTAAGVEPVGSPLAVSDDGTLVELDAVGGQIRTQLNVRTIKASLSGLSATLTGANAPPPAALTVIGGNAGGPLPMATTFATPDPGTHQWTVTVPPGPSADRPLFVPVDASGGPSPQFFQAPGRNIAPSPEFPQLTKTYAEMGAMNLRVTNSRTGTIAGATGTLTPVGGGTPIPFTTDGAGNATLLGLPVSTALNGTGSYQVALTGPGDLDFGQAVFTVTGAAGPTSSCGTACAVVPIAQGGQPLVAIRVPRFGTLAGTVLGDNGTPAGVPLFPPDLTVIAERIAVDCTEMAAEPRRDVIPVDLDGDGEDESFRFSGPPGMYRLRFEHPAYQSEPTSGPPQELQDCQIPNPVPPPALLPNPNPNLNGAVFRVTNDQDRVLTEPFFTLLIRPSEVFVDVLHDSLTLGANGVGTPVPAATVRIGPDDADPTTGTDFLTDANGEVNLTADADRLDPGVYLIEVSKTVAVGTPEYFPLAVRLTIPPGGNPVTLRVPLSRIGGSITGRVGAVNSEQDPVAPPAGIQVTSVADAFDPAATNATVDPAPNPGPGTGTVTPPIAGSPPGAPNTFQFDELRSGTYTLTFNDPGVAGYSPPSPNPIVPAVTVLGPVPVDVPATVNYTVANRVVEVTVVDAGDTPIEEATVTLDDPDSGPPAVLTTGVDGVVRFENVPPEIQPYQVTVSKDLFTTVGPTALPVPPGDPAVAVTPADVVLRGSQSRIRGRAELLSSPGNQGPLTVANSIQLVRDANGVPVGDPVTPDSTGRFVILTGVPDRYRVRVSGAGFATRESAAFDVVLGRPEVVPGGAIVVPALATVNVTVTGPAATTVTGRAVPTTASTPAPAAPSVAGSVFTFRLDPGDTYRFEFTSTAGYVPLTVPAPPAAAQSVAPGQVVPLTAAMQQRTITGTISGGTATVVRAVAATGTTPAFIDGTVTGNTYTITGVPNGTWTIQAAGFRVGRGVSTASETVGSTTGNVTAGPAVTLTPRDVTITFTVTPPNASIAVGGGTAQPAPGGTLQVTRPENATFPIAFTVTAPGFVADSDDVPAPTAPSDPYAPGFAVTAPTVDLVRVVVTARVDSSTGTAVTDAQVFLCAGSVAACGPTTVGRIAMTFSDGLYRGSPTAAGAWTVGATSGTLDAVTGFTVSDAGVVSASPVVVTLPAPPPPPTTTTTTTTTTAAPGGG
jgi:hypothetical protein